MDHLRRKIHGAFSGSKANEPHLALDRRPHIAIDDDSRRRRVALDLRRLSRGRRLPEVGLNQGCKPVVSEARREPRRWESQTMFPARDYGSSRLIRDCIAD